MTISTEQKAKISASLKAYWANPEKRATRISKIITAEERSNRSAGCKAAWADPQKRANMTNAHKGKKRSWETRSKMAVKHRGNTRCMCRSLTFEQAQEVRVLRAEGLTYKQLADKFKLNRSALSNIVNGRTYAPDPPDVEEAIAVGGIKAGTTQAEWESLSPGMRREIVRSAQKEEERCQMTSIPSPGTPSTKPSDTSLTGTGAGGGGAHPGPGGMADQNLDSDLGT